MYLRRRAVASLLTLGLAVQVAYPAPPVPADGGQVQTESVPAILRIRVAEGEGAIHTVRARSTQPIVVFLTDETGHPVSGAAVSVRLPEDGPTGVFANGMRTDIAVTGADGRASIHGIFWGSVAGPVQVRITASKGEARAGILFTQHITAPAADGQRRGPASPKNAPRPAAASASGRSKWILLALLAGGAAAGGVAAATGRGTAAAPGASAAVMQPTASIGNPSIIVSRP